MTQIWVALIVYLILWFVKKNRHALKRPDSSEFCGIIRTL